MFTTIHKYHTPLRLASTEKEKPGNRLRVSGTAQLITMHYLLKPYNCKSRRVFCSNR